MLKVIYTFHTRDGEWFRSDKPYSLTKDASDKYGGDAIPGRGGAHHIFVKVPVDAHVVEFNTEDGRNKVEKFVAGGEWVNHPIFQAYDPDNGEVGAWLVRVDGEKVAEGIGLPYGWHVSTYLVVDRVEQDVPQVPVGGKDRVQLFLNGVIVFDSSAIAREG